MQLITELTTQPVFAVEARLGILQAVIMTSCSTAVSKVHTMRRAITVHCLLTVQQFYNIFHSCMHM